MNFGGRLPTTITMLPSYNCTAACENCCFGSHPGIEQRIPLERMLDYIDQAAEMKSIRLLVFSGGECFMLGDDLVIAVAHATIRGIATRCVSNGYWAASDERAHARLEPLWRAGLRELNISTGDYHQQFVKPSKVVTGALAAVALGMKVVVVVESRKGRGFTAEHLYSDSRFAAVAADSARSHLLTVIESPWISMQHGDAIEYLSSGLTNRTNLHSRKGCDSVLNTIVVTPSEQLGACCGLTREQINEMHVGSLRDTSLRELYQKAVQDLLKIWIFVEGPEQILAWAATKDSAIEWENKYSHHCDACRALYHDPRVRRVIREHYHEKENDILLRFALLNSFGMRDESFDASPRKLVTIPSRTGAARTAPSDNMAT